MVFSMLRGSSMLENFGFLVTGEAIENGQDWFVSKPVLEKTLEWQLWALLLMSVLAMFTLLYAIKISRKVGRYPIYVVLGAALATYYEPLGDLFAHVTYHEANQLTFTQSFGFKTPLWILPTYIVFFGASIIWLVSRIDEGVSVKQWWVYFVLSIPGAWVFEVPLLEMGAIAYYGDNQPFRIFGYPLWMAFSNSATIFLVSAAVAWLKGTPLFLQRPILLVPVIPMLVLGANGGVGLPLGSAINGTDDVVVVQLMACASILLAVFYVRICERLICTAKASATV